MFQRVDFIRGKKQEVGPPNVDYDCASRGIKGLSQLLIVNIILSITWDNMDIAYEVTPLK